MTADHPSLRGLYKLPLEERQERVANAAELAREELVGALANGGLAPKAADKIVENVIGTYALPFGVLPGLRVNGRDHLVPMVIEEPSVIAAATGAAKLVREAGGGFSADADPPIMTAQIQLYEVPSPREAAARISSKSDELLAAANCAVPGLVQRGGGARSLEVRIVADGMIVVHVDVDCRDAMGANLVNQVAEALGDRVAELGGGRRGLRVLSNLSDRRCARARCAIPLDALAKDGLSGSAVAEAIANASRFAEVDRYRAATHNKGIMNGIDAVVLATGNDWRAVEAGAHAFAAREGGYRPLATWYVQNAAGSRAELVGALELPMALGTVGGTLRVHPAARLAIRLLRTESAQELAQIATAVGLATNFAALRALATTGIQKGHMALHARSVASAAGAAGDEVEQVAARIVATKDITLAAAQHALAELRAGEAPRAWHST